LHGKGLEGQKNLQNLMRSFFFEKLEEVQEVMLNTDFLKKGRVSSPKKENYVINYSPSCHSTTVDLFIFGTQIKIFFIKSDGSVRPL